MILFELTESEKAPAYQALEVENAARHYSFLQSMVTASLAVQRPFLSETIIKAINFHAIVCLHTNPGEYRPCPVEVGKYKPPQHYRVPALMDDFVNMVNRQWEASDAVLLATYVLWKLNHIHPFINGNGRTARAASYYVLCVKQGGLLPGDTILPQLLQQNRPEYVIALQAADESLPTGNLDLSVLHGLVSRLLAQQLSVPSPLTPAAANTPPNPD